MKKCLPLISGFLFLTNILLAQAPVFTSNFYPHPPGDTIITQVAYSEGVSFGDTGANQTWDYTSLKDSGKVDTSFSSVTAASGTKYDTLFPEANLVSSGNNDYEYFTVTSQLYEDDGGVDSFGFISNVLDTTIAEEPEVYFEYPFTYGTRFTNSYYYNTYTVSHNKPVTSSFYGTDTFNANGYGTLELPNGYIFNNVLRVDYSVEDIDPSDGDTSYLYEQQVSYYSPTYPNHALLNIFFLYDFSPSVDTFSFIDVNYYPNAPTAVNNINPLLNNLSVFPNPSHTQTQLSLNLKQALNITVYITNILGQKVKTVISAQVDAGLHNYQIETGDIANGMYLVTVEVNGSTAGVCKLVVE